MRGGPEPATGWATIGSLNYRGADTPAFSHYLRHSYDLSVAGKPIPATAFRIKVSNSSIAIDEIEHLADLVARFQPAERPLKRARREGSSDRGRE